MSFKMLRDSIMKATDKMSLEGPIIDAKGDSARKDIMRLIDELVHSFYITEKSYIKDGPRFDKKNEDTYTRIGESYCYLNELNSVIAAKLNTYISNNYGHLLKNYEDRVAEVIKSTCLKNVRESEKFKDISNVNNSNGKACFDGINILDKEINGIAIKRAVMYFKFFNNLSASRIKYVFFREHPVKSLNYPILGLGKDFADICYDLVDAMGQYYISLKQIPSYISKYCLLQELMFSFVYRQDNEFGVFLRFKYDEKKYIEISDKISKSIQDILVKDLEQKTINYKYFFVKVGHIIFSAYTQDVNIDIENKSDKKKNFTEAKGDFAENLLTQKRDSFIKFYNLFDAKKGDLYLEPLTYQLYDILWKVHGVIDITDKSRDHKVYQGKVECIKRTLVKFVRSYLSQGAEIYKTGSISYHSLYNMGAELFGVIDHKKKIYHPGIYTIIFKEPYISEVCERLERVNKAGKDNLEKNKKTLILAVPNILSEECNIQDIPMNDESDYKLENLIITLPPKIMLQLLHDFSAMVNSGTLYDNDGAYMIGFYKSGVFLAHIANMLLDFTKRRDVWLFNTKPYVATHPIHKDERWRGVKKIILIDDSIKTGFTYSLYESYVKRNAVDGKDGMVINLFSLFNYSYYKRLEVISQNNYACLWKIRKSQVNNDHLNCDWDYSTENKMSDLWKTVNYIEKDFDAILDAIEDKEKEVDLSFFLTNTDLLLTICVKFIDEILERRNKDNKEKKIFLYSPTSNGYVIMMMCLFLLRFVYGENVGIVDAGIKKSENNFLVVIDLSFVSGFTIMYNWSIDTGGEYIMREANNEEGKDKEGVDVEQVKKEFDLCEVVYCSCKSCVIHPCTRCNNFIYSLNPKNR